MRYYHQNTNSLILLKINKLCIYCLIDKADICVIKHRIQEFE